MSTTGHAGTPAEGMSPSLAAAVGADESDDVRMVARGGLANLAGACMTGVFQFLLVVAVARGLHRAQSGAFFESVALFTILSNTCELGADTGLTRFIPRFRVAGRIGDIRRTIGIAVWPSLASGILFAALVFAFAHPLAEVFTNHKAANAGTVATYLRVLALFLPLSCCYTVVIAGTRGFGTMMPNALVDRCARPALQFSLVVLVLVLTDRPALISAAWATPIALGLLAGLLWLALLLRRAERQGAGHASMTPAPTATLAREFWVFTAPRGLTGAFQVTIIWVGTLMVGSLMSTPSAAVYTAATRYLVAGSLVNTAIIQVIAPKLAGLLGARLDDRARNIYRVATAWLVLLAWPMYLTLALWAPVLLTVFGHHYAGGASSLAVLAVTMLVATGVGPIDMVLLMGGRSSLNLLNVVVALALNLTVGYLLIPRMGIVGAALGLSAAILMNNVAPLLEVRTFIAIDPFGRAFAAAAAAAVGCFGAVGLVARLVYGESPAAFLVASLLASAVYVVALFVFRKLFLLTVLRQTIERKSGRKPGGSLEPKPPAYSDNVTKGL
jgi:O-antigen/teichoic acid export membrane protein